MASTRFRMIGVALFVVALSALEAIQWDGGPADWANITACVGGIASIPWSFVKGDGETLLSLAWSFLAPGKEKTQIATSNNGHFYTTNKERLAFLPTAGLSLRDARPQDSGDYSVQVQLLKADSSLVTDGRMVTLSVTDTPPATLDGDLHVTLSDAVRDDVTKDWTVPLYCGHFVNLGHPPVGVVWTTPAGEVRNSGYENNGTFVLSVSSSVQGGNYSCHLPPSAPAVRCLTATSPLNAAAQLYVDDKDVRFALLEAQQQETKAELQETKAELQETKTQQKETKAELQKTQTQQQETKAKLQKTQTQQRETKAELQKTQTQQQETKAELQETKTQLQETNTRQSKLIGDFTAQIQDLNGTVYFLLNGFPNCADLLEYDHQSGVRDIKVSGQTMAVYCDQVTDNGGWTVFQRRKDASVDFFRGWTDYRNGFGDLEGNFWLGMDKLHTLTTSQKFEMRVDLHMWNGTRGYATYSGFYVDDAAQNFTLHYDWFTGGNAGESLYAARGQQFSTKDNDHDSSHLNCAQTFHGAWWYWSCLNANLNGEYKPNSSTPMAHGMIWKSFVGSTTYSMKFSEMKIRPM